MKFRRFQRVWSVPLSLLAIHCAGVESSCPDGQTLDADSGLCVAQRSLCADVDCDDDDDCTRDVCNPDDGTCLNSVEDDGTSCSLGDVAGICAAGQCEEAGLCGGLSCDDGNECTNDICDSEENGPCRNEARVNGTVCDFEGQEGICFDGVCEDAGECANTDCRDGIECTQDLCVRGECTEHVADDTQCDDADSCTDDICNPQLGCENPPLPAYSVCDDGAPATFPDVCRSGVCTGAIQGEMTTPAGTFEAIDIARTTASYAVLLNERSNVHVHELISVSSSQSLGSVSGEGHRLHPKGSSVYVAAGRLGDTSGGLDCDEEFSGACPLLGVWDGSGDVEWGGTTMHSALNGLGLSGIYAINAWVDVEQVICEFPPCNDPFDTHWWFVGQRLSIGPRRPHAVHCVQRNFLISCDIVSNGFANANYDDMWFIGAELSSDSNVFDPEFKAALFGMRGDPESSVVVDADADPNDSLPTTSTQGPFDTSLRGSFSPTCNNVIQYGDGGSLLCEADDLVAGPFPGCEAATNWECSPLITGRNFVHGARAGASVLVTPTHLYAHQSGSRGDSANWTPIDFELPSGVSLAAVAGDTSEWYVLANDSNSGKVRVYKFTW